MLRLLPFLEAAGPEQMALDEALLEEALVPSLRLYRWRPETLSLGYFQNYDEVAARLPGPMAMVRRITGGGAIWHQHEVTYCLVGRLGAMGLPARMRDCYHVLHGGILAALARYGAAVALQDRDVGDRRYRSEPRCFASPAVADLVHPAGGKVLGSAGRDRGGRVLIHGSLKLASNPWDGAAVAGCGVDGEVAARALIEGICSALGLGTVDGTITPAEIAAAERIRGQRYGDEAWVRQRKGPRP
jgi:lipoate-protein ligase A